MGKMESDVMYKAVRLDRRSHYDGETLWRVGKRVMIEDPDPPETGPCGRGIHASPTLLDVVSYQTGPSRYYRVQPIDILASDKDKSRMRGCLVLNELSRSEQDEIAGFNLWEANHPINPLLLNPRPRSTDWMRCQLAEWASVRDSVWASVWDSVRDSVWDSVYGYIGSMFPGITRWKYIPSNSSPWEPIRKLWLAGYVPSFDGEVWRLHAHNDARVVFEWRKDS